MIEGIGEFALDANVSNARIFLLSLGKYVGSYRQNSLF
jgi:hypothetical protein